MAASLMAEIPEFTPPSMSHPQRRGEARLDRGLSWTSGRPGPGPLELSGMFPPPGKCQGSFLSLMSVHPKAFLLWMPALQSWQEKRGGKVGGVEV